MINVKQILIAFCLGLLIASGAAAHAVVAQQETPTQEEDSADSKDDRSQEKKEGKDEQKEMDGDDERSIEDLDADKAEVRKRRRSRFRANSKESEEFISVFESVVASTVDNIVKVTNGKRQIALGTVVDQEGYVLTKLSELRGQLECQLSNGDSYEPEVIGIDPDTDLVLLKIEGENLGFARIEELQTPEIGSWLASVGTEKVPVAVGIVSHEARIIPDNELNSAVIGIYPEDIEDEDGVRVNVVVADSPAEDAGVLVNDIIIGIDDEKILSRAELLEKLSHFQPGDEIELKVKRGEETKNFDLILGKRSINRMMDRGRRQNEMGSTLSKRRGDFPLALQHDSTLNANECGGPVVDLDGRIVGVNIARDGRVSSLALPNEIVLPIIAQLKTGKYKPETVNRSEIRQVENLLTKLKRELGDLPSKKSAKDIEFQIGVALETELEEQVQDAKARYEALRERLKEKRSKNRKIDDDLKDLSRRKLRIESRTAPLESDLKRLKTGIR